MSEEKTVPSRFIGLDVHKHYLIAIGVDAELNQVLGPQRVQLSNLDDWMRKQLTLQDAVALEATTNAFPLYDELLPHAHSVTVVHPPHVALITRAQVMTDKIAALTLARLLAVGLLPPVWVPPWRCEINARWWRAALKWCACPSRPRIVCTPCCTVTT